MAGEISVNINQLPGVESVQDDALFVAEQQNAAVKVTGLQFKNMAINAVEPQVSAAKGAAATAQEAASNAAEMAQQVSDGVTASGDNAQRAKDAAEAAQNASAAIENMTVSADTIGSDEQAFAEKSVDNGVVNIRFGIPKGRDGTGGEGGGGVTSFNNRTGAVMPKAGDYAASQVDFTPSSTGLHSTNIQGAIEELAQKVKDGGTGGGSGGNVDLTDVVKTSGGGRLILPVSLFPGMSGPWVIEFTPEDDGSGGEVTPPTPKYEIGKDWHVSGTLQTGGMPAQNNWGNIAYGNNIYVATSGGTSYGFIGYSEDGLNWSYINSPGGQGVHALGPLTYGNGRFVCVEGGTFHNTSSGGDKAVWSANGIDWYSTDMPDYAKWTAVTYGKDKFVAVANQSDIIAYSADGETWDKTTLSARANLSCVVYGNGKFVAIPINAGEKALYSTDGINWNETDFSETLRGWAITFGNGKFIAVGLGNESPYETNEVRYSTDGITWDKTTFPFYGSFAKIAFGGGIFVVTESPGGDSTKRVAYSKDGINWEIGNIPTSAQWCPIVYGEDKFILLDFALGSDKVAYSYTGN